MPLSKRIVKEIWDKTWLSSEPSAPLFSGSWDQRWYQHVLIKGFPSGSMVKIHVQSRRWEFNPWVRKIPWRRVWQSTPIFLPGESHGQGSLVGYSPWGQKESDMTEHAPKLIKSLKCKLAQGSVDTAVDKDDPWPQGSCNPVRRQSLKQEQQGDHCLVGACALVQAECRKKVLLGGGGIQGGFPKLRRNADVLFVGPSPHITWNHHHVRTVSL